MSAFAIEVETVFAAAHQLRLPGGTLEPLHGHNWHVRVRVASRQLDALETVMDFHRLEQLLQDIVGPLNHQYLNALPPFAAAVNPSAERVAEYIGRALTQNIPAPARLVEVRVTEAPGCAAIWSAEK